MISVVFFIPDSYLNTTQESDYVEPLEDHFLSCLPNYPIIQILYSNHAAHKWWDNKQGVKELAIL